MFDEVILSTSLMDKVISVDQTSGQYIHDILLPHLSLSLSLSLFHHRSHGVSSWLCARGSL